VSAAVNPCAIPSYAEAFVNLGIEFFKLAKAAELGDEDN
jgi:L-asparaginase II